METHFNYNILAHSIPDKRFFFFKLVNFLSRYSKKTDGGL